MEYIHVVSHCFFTKNSRWVKYHPRIWTAHFSHPKKTFSWGLDLRWVYYHTRARYTCRIVECSAGVKKMWGLRWSRWWFDIFVFLPLPGEDSHFDSYFSDGLKPPTSGIFRFHVSFRGAYVFFTLNHGMKISLSHCLPSLKRTNSEPMDGWKLEDDPSLFSPFLLWSIFLAYFSRGELLV